MDHYSYQCFDCRSHFASDEIEPAFQYLCPKCGSAEKNQPLKGVLWIEYDYEKFKQEMPRKKFLSLPCGEFWHYPQLWPLSFRVEKGKYIINKITPQQLSRVRLNANPLLEYQLMSLQLPDEGKPNVRRTIKSFDQTFSKVWPPAGFPEAHKVLFFDDSRNPTLSYKDRASVLVALKALQMGVGEIAAASTGNAGSSLAGICARLGLKAHLFVPKNIPTAKRLQIQAYGANLYLVEGDYDRAFDLSLEVSKEKGWYNRNTAYNPLTIEGKKSSAYDIFIASRGHVPGTIWVPVGDGVILAGIYKGFWELLQLGWIEKLPRLMAVQAAGSNALVRFLDTGKFEYRPAVTAADSISGGAPRNLYMAAHAIKETNGAAVEVTDEEIFQAQQYLARHTGLLVEPASAASLAGFRKFDTQTNLPGSPSSVLLMMTGNGLKDIAALEKWNPLAGGT